MASTPITLPLLTGPLPAASAGRGRTNSGAWNDAAVGANGTGTQAAGVAVSVVLDGEVFGARSYDAVSEHTPVSTFFAQHVAQEVLPEGLYIDPHPAGIAAYRDVLTLVATQGASTAGLDLRA